MTLHPDILPLRDWLFDMLDPDEYPRLGVADEHHPAATLDKTIRQKLERRNHAERTARAAMALRTGEFAPDSIIELQVA